MDVEESTTSAQSVRRLEEIELRDQDETKEEVYKSLLIHYLLEEEPVRAKLLWKRIPNSVKQGAELARLWNLAQFFIQRQYSNAFELINTHKSASGQIQFFAQQDLNDLVTLLVEKTVQRLFDLVGVAYSSIRIRELAAMLQKSNDQVVKMALDREWLLDESNDYLFPKSKQENQADVNIANKVQMNQLTSLVSYLEAI